MRIQTASPRSERSFIGRSAFSLLRSGIGSASGLILRTLPFLFFALPGLVTAQTGDFSITSWDTRNGLPESLVEALAVRADTGVWVATEGGICLFDGSSCKPLPIEQAGKLPRSPFNALLVAHDGTLWAGTEGNGLFHLAEGRLESFTRKDGLSDGYVRAIYEDSRGRLWVGTDYGLFEKKGPAFQYVPLGKSASPQYVHAIVEDEKGRLIVGGKSLTIIDADAVTPMQSWGESSQSQIKSLLYARQNHLIVGTVDGAFEMDGAHFRRLPVPYVDVESLCQSGDGAIWAGTVSAGLWRLKDGQASRVGFREWSIARTILAMTTDARGRLWVGTQRGLSRIEETPVHFVRSPAQDVDRETLVVNHDGGVNLVNGSIFRIENRRLQPLAFPIPKDTRILDALYSRDRSVWLGTAGLGVYRLDSMGRVKQYSTQSRLKISTDYPRGIVEGMHGDIWVATEFGVNVIRRDSVELLSVSNGLPSRGVRTLFPDRQGCMWIGTDAGPSVWCNGTLVQNKVTSALNGEEIWAIAQDANGTMWFGTQSDGIYAAGDSGIRHLTTADGLPSDDICGLIVDRTGTLWVSSLDSIFSISPSAAVIPGEKELVIPRSYVLPSEAEGIRFTRGRFQSATLDGRGAVWFATDHGAVFIDRPTPSLGEAADAPTPVIRSVVVDNSILPAGSEIRTAPNPRRVVIAFDSQYLGPVQETLLMYRLKGVDEGWLISSGAQQAEYSNLSAGSYQFEVKACDRTQPDRWKTTSCLIIVPVIWYRSLWFYLALVAAILGTAFLAYTMHLRRIHYGFRLILEERNRLAREMHDTLIQGCNGVAMLLEAEASRRDETAESSLLSVARAQIRTTVTDARDALWNLRQSHTDSNYVRNTLQSIAAHATRFFDVPVDVRLPRRLPILPSSSAHELMMIVREAVTNAGTHGSPRRITVSAQGTSERLSIEVADDGIGFDAGSATLLTSDHYGIRGMQERAAAIGASFDIASKPGAGTVVRVSLPCH